MIVRKLVDQADGSAPQVVEFEAADPTAEEIASLKAAREERARRRENANPGAR